MAYSFVKRKPNGLRNPFGILCNDLWLFEPIEAYIKIVICVKDFSVVSLSDLLHVFHEQLHIR